MSFHTLRVSRAPISVRTLFLNDPADGPSGNVAVGDISKAGSGTGCHFARHCKVVLKVTPDNIYIVSSC